MPYSPRENSGNVKFILKAFRTCSVLMILTDIRCVHFVKCTLVQALRLCAGRTVHRGSRGIALPFHDHGTRRGEGSGSRPGRSLLPGKTR